ncbi:Uncharacterized protein M6B38_248680 [Iris pallida]|uniref:DUF7054 domain-containing protein n=1 Tax=Iris pallida TaxID=29817 RepID=A0AAX6DFD3_IRIPA|nr:Uncharacterized protein M6B38_248680 [Iris pallida]
MAPKLGGGGLLCRESRSASFHGRTTAATAASEPRQMRRPKTHPDLLGSAGAGAGAGSCLSTRSSSSSSSHDHHVSMTTTTDHENRGRRVPAKVLVNVTVQRSLGPLQVMASTEWTVEKLVEEALKQYRKEGRRPLLATGDHPSAFGLHYSQFSLESLDPKEKLIGLGSRNFFLCPKEPAAAAATAATAATATAAAATTTSSSSSSCSGEADKSTSKITIPWLRFMDFLL